VIASTNRDLTDRLRKYFSLRSLLPTERIPVSVPGLRERREDVPLLVNHFLKKYAPLPQNHPAVMH